MEHQTPDLEDNKSPEKRSGILMRIFFIFLGLMFVGLGIIGIPIPILPTTPFMLLAAYFFLRSSEKLNNWLRNHKYFKRFLISDGMTLWGKILLDGFVWIMLFTTAFLANQLWVWILTMSLGVTKTLYFIFILKTKPSKKKTHDALSNQKEAVLVAKKEEEG